MIEDLEKNFLWIIRVILSCENSFQLACCHVLLDRFKAMYDDNELYTQLLAAMSNQESKWSITT